MTLGQIAKIVKSETLLIFLGLISTTLFFAAIYSFTHKKTPQNQTPQIAWQDDIRAGVTTRNELESKLGPPLKSQAIENGQTLVYPSTNEVRPHEVDITGNTISTIKEQVIADEKGSLPGYIQKYGQPEQIIYGKHDTIAPGHFWGQNGLLIFANDHDGTIIEIWYFKPTTIGNFLQQNPDLSINAEATF